MNFVRASLASTAAAIMLVGATSVPSHAVHPDQVRNGVRVADSNGSCNAGDIATNSHVTVCFGAAADKLYVRDNSKDGRSAYGMFDGGWVGDRDACRNPYGVGTWVMCDYDLQEYIMAKFRGFTQDNEGWPNPEYDHTNWVYECTTAGGCS